MQRCSHCDHIHLIEAALCERCGAPLPPLADEPAADASPPPPGSLEAEILALAASKGKIEAIKHYRQSRSASLKDAKDAVEGILAQYGAKGSGSGCAVLLLFAAIAGACCAAAISA